MGALTSRPYSFTQRPWELYSCLVNPIIRDLNIVRIDFDKGKVIRVLPTRINKLYWLSDNLRFFIYKLMFSYNLRKLYNSSLCFGELAFYCNNIFPSYLYKININKFNSINLIYSNINLNYISSSKLLNSYFCNPLINFIIKYSFFRELNKV